MKFEDTMFFGPLSEFLHNCQPHRIEAIYNTDYRYIKEIIWDDDLNKKYGLNRSGYERFKKNEPGFMTDSGRIDLRARLDKDGNVIGYVTETKRTSNDSFNIMFKQFEDAKEKMFEILEVKDRVAFGYWLETEVSYDFSSRGPNETINSIQRLERIINQYNDSEEVEFRAFIDKIKG